MQDSYSMSPCIYTSNNLKDLTSATLIEYHMNQFGHELDGCNQTHRCVRFSEFFETVHERMHVLCKIIMENHILMSCFSH